MFVEHCCLAHITTMHPTLAPVFLALSIASTVIAIGPDCLKGPLATNKICDVNASPPERAAALVAAMEDIEKLDNLMRYIACRIQI